MEQPVLILSMLLLLFIDVNEPQVEVKELVIQILVEMGFIEALRALCTLPSSQRGVNHHLKRGNP